jgi:hypothetical protein
MSMEDEMSAATAMPEEWHGTVSEGKHKASPEEVARFRDAFWEWLRDHETGDFTADLARFVSVYRAGPATLGSATYHGLHAASAAEH